MTIVKKRLFQGICLMLVILQSNYCLQAQESLPPNAEPGKCYVKCTLPDEYETVTDQILVREGYEDCEYYGLGDYQTVKERILVSEAYKTSPTDPPKLKVTKETLLVREAFTKVAYQQPIFEEVTDSILLRPATTEWVKEQVEERCADTNPDDCVMWCLIMIPAQYKTYTRWEMIRPPQWEETPIPAKYITIEKTVVETPSKTGTELVPAKYIDLELQIIASTGGARCWSVPAKYITIETQKMVKGACFPPWVEVPCKGKRAKKRIQQVKESLKPNLKN